MTNDDRPYPSLVFRTASSERGPFAPRSRLRFCLVDTQDGVGELVQAVVSTDDAVLYLDVVAAAVADAPLLLVINLHPTDRVYIVDLGAGAGAGGGALLLDAMHDLSTAQLGGGGGAGDLGPLALPSLRGLLESPAAAKVVFDARAVAAALCGVALRGVLDLQLAELAGRPAYSHRVRLRDLRACLE